MIGENYGIIHALKIDPNYFDDVVQGRKTFEIRKNDRGFKKRRLFSPERTGRYKNGIQWAFRACPHYLHCG